MTVGKEGISAKIIADSISESGVRMTTMELEYPRFIHSELMTHRMLSKNCASSRAIPVARMLELIRTNPAMPVWWGKNQAGMSAKEEIVGEALETAKARWTAGANDVADLIECIMRESDLHKQITNRLSEPWQRMKTVISGTEWANLSWLRSHEDAQPEFHELSICIDTEFANSVPKLLKAGHWHLPYVEWLVTCDGEQIYFNGEDTISLEDALKVSSSCCAQVSYRRLDDSLAKSIDVYNRLVTASRVHASPFEHQASPLDLMMVSPYEPEHWGKFGVTHMTANKQLWSGNLREWVQHRQFITGHSVW